jgi:tRNA(fMet)-specific endonuclease VapC
MFVFDTDHVSILQSRVRPDAERIRARMARHGPSAFYTPIISFHEQVLGWNAYINRARDLDTVCEVYHSFEGILATFAAAKILPFDRDAADRFEELRKQKIRIGTMDLRIAAIALSRGMTLLSRNLVDFRRIPGLVVEDWAA